MDSLIASCSCSRNSSLVSTWYRAQRSASHIIAQQTRKAMEGCYEHSDAVRYLNCPRVICENNASARRITTVSPKHRTANA
eukprot:2765356-Rhodomonas_salina.6